MVRALIRRGAYLDFEDNEGKVLLDYGIEVFNEKILVLLVDSGESLGKNMAKGMTLLFECIN